MPGLKAALEAIDNRSDFKTFMQNYAFAHGGVNNKGPRRDGPREEGFVCVPCTMLPWIVLTAMRPSFHRSPRSLRTSAPPHASSPVSSCSSSPGLHGVMREVMCAMQ